MSFPLSYVQHTQERTRHVFKRPAPRCLCLYMLNTLTYICIYFLFCPHMKYSDLFQLHLLHKSKYEEEAPVTPYTPFSIMHIS